MTSILGPRPNQIPMGAMLAQPIAAGPIKTTTLTSGSGTFTPAVARGLCHVQMIAPGGGGGRPPVGTQAGGAGGAGVTLDFWVRFDADVSYAIGAAGVGATTTNTAGTAGGLCRLGTWVAPGGSAGNNAAGGAAIVVGPGWVAGGKGGNGSSGSTGDAGSSPGGVPALTGTAAGGAGSGGYGGGGGGGDSTDGNGGVGGAGDATTGTAGANATGYGAGGGGGGAGGSTTGNGGNGSGGIIRIREYGNV